MSIFRSSKSGFIQYSVTKDGLIQTVQATKNTDGSLKESPIGSAQNIFRKDIPPSQYKGVVYALPTQGDDLITVIFPSLTAKNYSVITRETVK